MTVAGLEESIVTNHMKSELALIVAIMMALLFLGLLYYQSCKLKRKWKRRNRRGK